MPDMQENAHGRPTCMAIHRCKEVQFDQDKPFDFPMQPKMEKAKWEIPAGKPPTHFPAEAPEPDEEHATIAQEDLDPSTVTGDGSVPSQPPRPPQPEDNEPGLDYPFVWHGYSWFKRRYEILAGDRWMKRKRRSDGRGR